MIDSMLLAVPVASPQRLLSVALEAGEVGADGDGWSGSFRGRRAYSGSMSQADREGPGTEAGQFATGDASPTLVLDRSPTWEARRGEAASPGGGSPVGSPLSGAGQQTRAEMDGGSPEGREREVEGAVVEAERAGADSCPSVRGPAECTQTSSVVGR